MPELVLYRKYRPKTFKEIVGQEHVVRTLTNALKLDRVAHAYLFTGPRGTGKTTIARLLAKAINCENREGFEPCNRCPSCLEINENRALDLIEIDAASNRGIDEIRELRDGIKFTPTRLKYKVFIIDEVHMLTKEAFNALLKTLEEPPSHAVFVLATTEIHKVPQTIISRCQRFDFVKIPVLKIIERLKFICEREKINIEDEALKLIALQGDGALRDSEGLLGQISVLYTQNRPQNQITLKDVQDFLGVADISTVSKLVDLISSKKLSEAIFHINQVMDNGYDIIQFTKHLIGYFHKMMLLRVDPNLYRLAAPELTEEQFNVIIKQGKNFSSSDLNKILRILVDTENEMKFSNPPQLPLELAIIEIIGLSEDAS